MDRTRNQRYYPFPLDFGLSQLAHANQALGLSMVGGRLNGPKIFKHVFVFFGYSPRDTNVANFLIS